MQLYAYIGCTLFTVQYSLYAYTGLLYSLAVLLYSLAVLLYSLYGIHRHCCMSWMLFAVFLLYSLYTPPLFSLSKRRPNGECAATRQI